MKTLLLCCIFLTLMTACEKKSSQVIATLDADTITSEDIMLAYHMEQSIVGLQPKLSPEEIQETKATLLEGLIDHHLFLLQARRLGMTINAAVLKQHLARLKQGYSDKEFKNQLNQRGLTLQEWELAQQEKFLIQEWLQSEVLSQIQISQEDVMSYYKQNIARFVEPEAVHALHILVDKEEQAQAILEKLKAGVTFEELARQYSKSPEASVGGDLGFFTRESFPPVFTETCFSLKAGQVSEVITSDYGYHLFKVLEHRKERQKALTDVTKDIQDLLTQLKVQEKMAQLVKELRSQIELHIDTDALAQVKLQ